MMFTACGFHRYCELGRCRRRGYCAGNRRARTGLSSGLYEDHPPCFYAFRDVFDEVLKPVLYPALLEALGERRPLYDGTAPAAREEAGDEVGGTGGGAPAGEPALVSGDAGSAAQAGDDGAGASPR
ncbi:MAG: hypothetical protein BroJett030_23900 [Alphaproteobacteria bacterium]|nr:MAG: hypothetical protein BroJett030_23900 [Alphaproteobacteria bacterium]